MTEKCVPHIMRENLLLLEEYTLQKQNLWIYDFSIKNVYIEKLNDIVNKYSNTYHNTYHRQNVAVDA